MRLSLNKPPTDPGDGGKPAKREDTGGAQSIHRGLQAMKLLAGGPMRGMKLVDIAAELDLSYPTAYRIMRALEEEGMVQRANGSRRFIIGAEAAWIGLSASQRFPIAATAAPILSHINQEHGDTLLLSVKSGEHSVCVDHRAGTHGRQVTAAAIGKRLPLSLSPSGRAILAFLPDECSARIMANHAREESLGFGGPQTDLGTIKARGYLHCEGITVRNTEVLTVPVFDAGGLPIAAISAIATRSRMGERRLPALLRSMNAAARAITGELLHRYAAENHRPRHQGSTA